MAISYLFIAKFIFKKKHLQSQLEIEKLKTENDAKKFQTLLNEYTKERVIKNKKKKQFGNLFT